MASGKLMQFDTATNTPQAQLDVLASKLALSSDGLRLAVATPDAGGSTVAKVLSLPSGTVLSTSPYTAPLDVILSGSPTEVGIATGHVSASLSPDANLLSVPTGDRVEATTTQIYNAGALATAVPGWAVGWLDNSRLLVNRYNPILMLGQPTFAGVEIYSPAGALLGASPLTELLDLHVVDADHVYSTEANLILSVSTGATTRHSINPYSRFPAGGTVAGSKVVFVSDTVIRAEIP
jgi:hypothetical protein